MRKLLFLLSLSVAAISANGQTAIPVSHLHGNIESVELVSGDTFLVAINPLTDGSGQSTGTAVSGDGTFAIWRNCKRYVVTDTDCPTCYRFGSSVLVEVTGDPGNGQPALGNVEIVNETPDGIGSFVANAGTDIQQCLLAYYAAKVDGSVTNELQTISIDGTDLTLSDGGGTVSIEDADGDPTNEIQTLTFAGDTLTISGGNTVDLSTLKDGRVSQQFFNEVALNGGYAEAGFGAPAANGFGFHLGGSGAANVRGRIGTTGYTSIEVGRQVGKTDNLNGIAFEFVGSDGLYLQDIGSEENGEMLFIDPVTHKVSRGSRYLVTDQRTTKSGIEYAADYSADYTDRSLVDKEYVDTEIAGVQGDTSSTNEIQDLASVLAQGNGANALKITNMADGTVATDAATFGQVQAAQTAAQAYADANDDVDDADADPTNELQTISISGTDLTLSNGGGTVSLDDADADPENEGKIYLSAGGENSSVINSTTPNSPTVTIEGVGMTVTENLETNTITLTSGDGSATNELDTLVNTDGTLLVSGDTINSSNDFWYTAPNDMSGFFPPLAVYLDASGQVQPAHAPTGTPAQYILAEKDGQRVRLVGNGTVDWPTPGGTDGQRWLNTGGGTTTAQPTENVQPLYTKTGDLMVVNVHPGFEFVPDAALIPITVQLLAPNSPVPGAGTELDNAAWVVPAEYNGYTVVGVSDGIVTKGSGAGDVQLQALVLSADRSGSSTFGTCTLGAPDVVDSSTASHVLTTGEAILGTVLANTMATPPSGLSMTLFLQAP